MGTPVAIDRSWRRFFRFRLRTLLIAMLVLALPLGWKVNQVRRQRAAVAAIEELGGEIGYESEFIGVDYPPVPPGPEWLRRWLGDDFFDHVVLIGGDVNVLRYAPEFPHLSTVHIFAEQKPIPGADLVALARCTELDALIINGCSEFSENGMAGIGNLTKLVELDLSSSAVEDSQLASIAALTSLRSLRLSSTRVQGLGLTALRHMKVLRTLTLSGTPCTGQGLEVLEHLPGLLSLELDQTKITDESMDHINLAENLLLLSLEQTNITDAGLGRLTRLKELGSIHLYGTNVTDQGVAELCERLPNIDDVRRKKLLSLH